MSKVPVAAVIRPSGSVQVLDAKNGVICETSNSKGNALAASVNGNIVTVITDQGFTVVYEIVRNSASLKFYRSNT